MEIPFAASEDFIREFESTYEKSIGVIGTAVLLVGITVSFSGIWSSLVGIDSFTGFSVMVIGF